MKRVSSSETGSAPEAISSIRSIDRACAVLAAFSLREPLLPLAELARRVGLPKPTVYRVASSLVAAGFMTQAADGRYGLGFKLMELGAVVQQNLDMVRTCSAAMETLADETGETVLLAKAEWPSAEVVIVARRDSAHPLSVLSPVGRRSTIPPGCLGKALLIGMAPGDCAEFLGGLRLEQITPKTHTEKGQLLEELARARAVGFAIEQDEFLEHVSGVAVPVIFDGARPLGALGVVGPSSRLGASELEQIGLRLTEVTRDLWQVVEPRAATSA